jgi:hypothetical protein
MADSEQRPTRAPQPTLRIPVVGTRALDQRPEARPVILLAQVHQLVNQDVVAHEGRHLNQPEVEGDGARARAGPPARALCPDGDTRELEAVLAGKFGQSRDEQLSREGSQICLNVRPDVIDVPNAHGPAGVAGDRAIRLMDHDGLVRDAVEPDSSAGSPAHRRLLFLNSCTLLRDPGEVTRHECHGFGFRSAAWDGDAQGAVRTDAHDVAPGLADPDEFDPGLDVRWRLRSGFRERKIELHGLPR